MSSIAPYIRRETLPWQPLTPTFSIAEQVSVGQRVPLLLALPQNPQVAAGLASHFSRRRRSSLTFTKRTPTYVLFLPARLSSVAVLFPALLTFVLSSTSLSVQASSLSPISLYLTEEFAHSVLLVRASQPPSATTVPLSLLGTKVNMECVVQGIIETQHVEALEILLQGLCGVQRERLRIHEICLKSGPNLGPVASEVRLLCDLEQAEPSWTVRHIGGAMRGAGAEQISVLVRTMVESKASKNVLRMFYLLGYKLDHELLRVGFSFHFNRGAQITVTVSSINKMLKVHATDEAVPVTPGIQLVEVTAPATGETYAEVASAVSSFCEYLAPLLHLSKPGISTGVVPTAAAAAASLMSDGGGTTL